MPWFRNIRNGEVTLDQAEMSFVSFGHGDRALIVLPGLSDGLTTVRGKALLLAGPYVPVFDKFTVYMFSRKDPLPAGASIRDMARDQARAMELLGIKRASVLGVSQGGMIAEYLALDAPEMVDRLVLAMTAPRADELVRERVSRWIELAEQRDHKALMTDTAENSYSPAYLKKYRKLYPVLGLVGRPASYERFLINARAILAFDARRDLPGISCPTLILGGEKDRIVGSSASRELKELIPGSELYLYPELGHAAYEEAPDFYPRVFRFLEASK